MEDLYILIQVRQYGPTGHRFKSFIGAYSSQQKLKEEIEFFVTQNPWNSDTPYHFEIFNGPVDLIGEGKEYQRSVTHVD